MAVDWSKFQPVSPTNTADAKPSAVDWSQFKPVDAPVAGPVASQLRTSANVDRSWGEAITDTASGIGQAGFNSIAGVVRGVNDRAPGAAEAERESGFVAGLLMDVGGKVYEAGLGAQRAVGKLIGDAEMQAEAARGLEVMTARRAQTAPEDLKRSGFAEAFAEKANEYADAVPPAQSEKARLISAEMAQLSQTEYLSDQAFATIDYFASPFLRGDLSTGGARVSKIMESLIPSLAAGGIAAKAVGAAGAGAGIQTAAQLGTMSVMEGGGAADGARGEVLNTPIEALQAAPEFQAALRMTGGDPLRARDLLADQAASISFGLGTGAAIGTMGLGQAFGANVAEQAVREGVGSLATGAGVRQALLGVAGATGKEFASEFAQGASNQAAQNVGTFAAGTNDNLGRGVVAAGIMEGIAGGASGVAAQAAAEVSKRLRPIEDGEDLLGGSNVATGAPGAAEPGGLNLPDDPAAQPISSAEIEALRQQQLAALLAKRDGRPDQTVVDPVTGKPVTVRGEPKQVLSDAEKQILGFLQKYADRPDVLARALGRRLDDSATYGASADTTGASPQTSEAPNIGGAAPNISQPAPNIQPSAAAPVDADVILGPDPVAPAPVAPQSPAAQQQGVPTMITQAMKAQLRERGYTDANIRGMTPQQAWDAINAPAQPAPESQPAQPGPVASALRPQPADDLLVDQAAAELQGMDDETPPIAGPVAIDPQPEEVRNEEVQQVPDAQPAAGEVAQQWLRPQGQQEEVATAPASAPQTGIVAGALAAQLEPADPDVIEGQLPAESTFAAAREREIPSEAPPPESFIPQVLSEIGWLQKGGFMIRDPETAIGASSQAEIDPERGDVVDRTKWIGKPAADGTESQFWRMRPNRSLSEAEATAAVEKWRQGRKLGPRQQEFIDYMLKAARDYAEQWNTERTETMRAIVDLEAEGIVEERDQLRAAVRPDISPEDEREALQLDDLLRRAAAAGATREQLLDILTSQPERQQAKTLWHFIKTQERDRGTDEGRPDQAAGLQPEAGSRGQAEPDRSGEAAPRAAEAEPAAAPAAESRAEGLTLSAPAAPPVSQQARAPSQQGALFAPPTRGEVLAGERKRRDDERDGKNATGRTDMMAGEGELFAGPRPEQVDVEQAIESEQAASPSQGEKFEATRQPSANTIFTEDAAAAARARLKAKLGRINSGIDPEMLQDGITLAGYHIERGARTFAAYARAMVEDMGDAVRPFLKSWYLGVKFDPRAAAIASEMDSAAAVESADANQEFGDVPSAPRDVERAGEAGPADASDLAESDGAAAGQDAAGAGSAGGRVGAGAPRSRSPRGAAGGAAAGGARGDQRVSAQQPDGREPAPGDAGAADGRGSDGDGKSGIQADRDGARGATEAAAGARGDRDKLSEQRAAESIPVKLGDIENIRATLPYLLEGQQDDVAKAEARFAKPDGYGMLFTNGTGTGKTFTGLGVVKRFQRQGKTNVLIVAPSDKIMADWISSGVPLGLEITALANTGDAGRGIVVTTYANLGQNDALAKREWDLIVTDEAHYLMRSADGERTAALDALRAITLHPDGYMQRTNMLHRDLVDRGTDLRKRAEQAAKSDDPRVRAAGEALSQQAQAVFAQLKAKRDEVQADVMAKQGAARPRAVFLSATPFAYEKTVDWAQGYLFTYPESQGGGYNSPDSFGAFMMSNFGYRMRYGKLTAPEAGVDSGLMQRMFNTRLKREGVLSGRRLDVAADYSRNFVLVESAIGRRIDQAMEWLRENDGTRELSDKLRESFDYLARRYTLEALKARESVELIREHIALGRKVVVFHDYKKGGARNPFDFDPNSVGPTEAQTIEQFRAEFGDLIEAMGGLISPIDLLQREFPSLLLFNGDVSPKNRRANVDTFNDDGNGPQVILVQTDAGKEGISLHDTTGKHQRALINLGMPTKPTDLIQQEGRIYRTGQVSNAIFSYLNTGTSWERATFAQTIAGRASAAENLGMGEEARALKDSLVQSFEDSARLRPGYEGEGTGGKAADAAAARMLTEHDRAVALYYANQKKTSRTKSAEGVDYFATPEPVGLAMVRMADIRPGESALEPSAGHGAIARWFGDTVKKTAVEPSAELASRLALSFDGRIVDGRFESLDLVNKFDGIVMNPPFGTAGRTAVDHVAKAAKHLREGGRLVALIPTGPAADKKFDAWLYELDDKGRSVHPDLHLVATVELPAVTFERAGTSVRTRIVVIDKMTEGNPPQQTSRDLSSAETIKDLFERVERLDIRPRAKVAGEVASFDTAPSTQTERKKQAEWKEDARESAKAAGTAPTGEPIVTHITGKGKELVGVVRTGITKAQAQAIDAYTFAKNGGWFIRVEHLKPAGNFSQPQPGDRIPMGALRSEAAMRLAVAAALDSWNGSKPIVRVVRTAAELPADAKMGEGWQTAEGYFDGDGGVWLVTENLSDPQRALEVLRHEAVGHFGVERIAGAAWPSIVAGVEAMRGQKRTGMSKAMAAALSEAEARYEAAASDDPLLFAKELIAVMAETGTRATFMDRMLSQLRAFLRKTGLIGEAFSEAELRNVLSGAFRLLERGGSLTAGAPVAAAGMQSIRPDDVAAYILRMMGQSDADLFRYPKSDSTSFAKVIKDVSRGEVSAVKLGEVEANFTENLDDLLPAVKWGLRLPDGAQAFVYVEQPSPYTPSTGLRMFLDASAGNSGASLGSAVYAGLFQWALNTGHTFIGDPNGLSTEALLRRTEHMLSAALKHGTTRMMAPHDRQVDPMNKRWGPSQEWASPLQWTDGDDVGNITALIRTSVENHSSLLKGTEADGVVYRLSDGEFVGPGGQPLADDGLRRAAAAAGKRFRESGRFAGPESRAAAVGGSTVARTLVLRSLLEGSTGSAAQRRALLADLAERLSSQRLTYDRARGLFYSRPGPDQLQPQDQTQTPEFRRWFGDSKVVDAEGRPLVFYHGGEPDFSGVRAGGRFNGAVFVREGAASGYGGAQHALYVKGPILELREMADLLEGARGQKALRTAVRRKIEAEQAELLVSSLTDGSNYPTDQSVWDLIGAIDEADAQVEIQKLRGAVARQLGFDAVRTPDEFGGETVMILSPEQIKSATGNRGTFDPADPRITFSRPRAAMLATRQRVQQLTSRETIDKLIYEFQDKFVDLKRIQAHIREAGGTVSDLNDAYLGEELYHSRVMARHERFMESELKPLLADLNAAGFTVEQFEQFLHARHAPEANAVLMKRNPDGKTVQAERDRTQQAVRALQLQLQQAQNSGMSTRAIEQALQLAEEEQAHWKRVQPFKGTDAERAMLSGMSDADAAAVMAALAPADRAKMDALAGRIDAINAKTLDHLERYGLMSRADLDAWRQAYQFYVPLHRDEANPDSASHPTGAGFSVRGDAAKSRTGSAKAKVTHILAHIAMQREAAITRGEKNAVAKKLYVLAGQNPDPNLWTLDKAPTITRVDPDTGTVRTMPDPMYRQKPNVVMVRIAGEDRAIVFNERNSRALRLAESLKNIDVDDLHKVLAFLGKGTRWLASVNTQYNPVFGIVNLIRDTQGVVLQLSTTPLKGKEAQVLRRIPAMLRSIYRERRGKGAASPEDARLQRLWDEMRMTGGVTGYRDLFRDPMERANAIEAELKKAERGMASRAAHAVVDWLSDYNEAIENATRLAAYEQALAQGMTKERAASIAKNITVNFNRKGRQARELGALYAFFNAAVQGTARMLETLAGPRGRAIMAGGVALGFVNSLIGLAVMGGDEWEKIPAHVKERAAIIPISGKDYISIPMPLGYHVFPNIGRIAAEMMTGTNETAMGSFGELFSIAADAFNPLGGNAPLAQMAAPTVFDPAVALIQNKDWTGRPIYREDFSSTDPTPGFTRSKDTASMPAKVIAWGANAITLGDDYEPGAFSPTPDQIDYVIGQLTGGLGREILKAQTTLTAPITGEELPAYKIPLVSRLYGNTRGQAGESERFYSNLAELNIVERRMKGMARAGDDVDAYMAAEPLTDLVGMGTRSQSVVQRLRSAQRQATAAGDAEQAEAIRAQITEVMAELNREVRAAKQ